MRHPTNQLISQQQHEMKLQKEIQNIEERMKSMRLVKKIEEYLNNYDKENCRILDVGCGRGDVVFELKNLGFHNVIGKIKNTVRSYLYCIYHT